LSAKQFGWNWMDPIMGIVGAVLVATWSWGMPDKCCWIGRRRRASGMPCASPSKAGTQAASPIFTFGRSVPTSMWR
jgi:hypothetical protein